MNHNLRGFGLFYKTRKGRELITNLMYLSPLVLLPDEITLFDKDEVNFLDNKQDHVSFIAQEDRNMKNLKSFLDYLKGKKNGSSGRYRIARAVLPNGSHLFFQPTEDNEDQRSIFCTYFPRGYTLPFPPIPPRGSNPTRHFAPPHISPNPMPMPYNNTHHRQNITQSSQTDIAHASHNTISPPHEAQSSSSSPPASQVDQLVCVESSQTEAPNPSALDETKSSLSAAVRSSLAEFEQLEKEVAASAQRLKEARRIVEENNSIARSPPYQIHVYLAKHSIPGGVHPSFLQTLSQIHISWILGAMAELAHNSRDAESTELLIDVEETDNENEQTHVLVVKDNGRGMTYHQLVQMLNFGHGEIKKEGEAGKFGIGFKTGSMRLAREVLILTQTRTSRSVGLLSQSLNTGNFNIVVPIVSFSLSETGFQLDLGIHKITDEGEAILSSIYAHARFKSLEQIMEQFNDIPESGTKILLSELKENELDFATAGDIRVASIDGHNFSRNRTGQLSAELDYSLRAYLELMFLRPGMTIKLRGSEVLKRNMLELPPNALVVEYRNGNSIAKLLLFNDEEEARKNLSGIHVYWHGVLILPYHRLGLMLTDPEKTNGVIGVIEADFLLPLSSKLSFIEDEHFSALCSFLAEQVDKYIQTKSQQQQQPQPQPPSNHVEAEAVRNLKRKEVDVDNQESRAKSDQS